MILPCCSWIMENTQEILRAFSRKVERLLLHLLIHNNITVFMNPINHQNLLVVLRFTKKIISLIALFHTYIYIHNKYDSHKQIVWNVIPNMWRRQLTSVWTCPGMTYCPPGVIPICCIIEFFKARWFRPFISNCSFKCCGGWKYLQGGFPRLQRSWNKKKIFSFKLRFVNGNNYIRMNSLY